MDLEKLMLIGKELGLSGQDLREWIDAERAKEREKRATECEAAKEAARLAQQTETETRARIEAERAMLELRLNLQERSQGSNASSDAVGSDNATNAAQSFHSPQKLIPAFNEERDELDAYIKPVRESGNKPRLAFGQVGALITLVPYR